MRGARRLTRTLSPLRKGGGISASPLSPPRGDPRRHLPTRPHIRFRPLPTQREGARDGTVYGRSRTAAKGFTSHWLRLISASIATSVGGSISLWADMTARGLLDAPDVTAATA